MSILAKDPDVYVTATFQYLVTCKDDVTTLREIVKQEAEDDLDIENLDDLTCTSLKESNLWKEKGLKPKNGPFDTWSNYCKSILAETFKNNIEAFPCAETCGFCTGMLNFVDYEEELKVCL